MTSPGMVDMTGQPRSDKDLQDAINAVSEIMVKHATVLPLFTLHAGTIRGCLLELQALRKLLEDVRKKILEGEAK